MRKRSQVWYTERWAGESSSQAPTMLDNLDLGIGNLHGSGFCLRYKFVVCGITFFMKVRKEKMGWKNSWKNSRNFFSKSRGHGPSKKSKKVNWIKKIIQLTFFWACGRPVFFNLPPQKEQIFDWIYFQAGLRPAQGLKDIWSFFFWPACGRLKVFI